MAARSADELHATVALIAEQDALPALAVPTDVGDGAQIEELFNRVEAELGMPTVLINNAGVYLQRPIVETTDDDLLRVLTTNLISAFIASRTFGRRLLGAASPGQLVNVSSVFGHVGVSGCSAYAMTKAGMDGLTRTLAMEWAKAGITVNSVAPGQVNTDLPAEQFATPGVLEFIYKSVPLGRIAEPEEVANLIAYLVSPAAAFLTGQSIVLDGGYSVR